MNETQNSDLSLSDFSTRLSASFSDYHVRMLIRTVLLNTGLNIENHSEKLSRESAKSICLELIKKGGPAFQVGKSLYSQVQ